MRLAELQADAAGHFMLPAVAPGTYTLIVSRAGFATLTRSLTITAGQGVDLGEIVLEAGSVRSSVVVEETIGFQEPVATTAARMPLLLRDIPQAVDVINKEVIRSQAALSLNDVLRNSPGVTVHLGEGRRDQVMIRGYSALNDQYVDGVRDDSLYYRDLSNVERVEVVKGPAAVLFGRGSSGGLVNRILKRPDPEHAFAEVSIIAGSYGVKRTEADLGAAFLDGKLSARLPGAVEDSGSFRDRFFVQRCAFTPSLLWRPTEHTEVVGTFDYLRDDRRVDRGIPSLNGGPAPVRISNFYGNADDDLLRNRVGATALTVDHRFRPHWSVRNVFRRTGYATDFNNTYADGTRLTNGVWFANRAQYNSSRQQNNLFNQTETVFSGTLLGLRHTALAGVEFGDQAVGMIQFRGTATALPLFNPALGGQTRYTNVPSTYNDFTGRVFGTYFQDQLAWGKWKALVGVRRDRYRQVLDNLLPNTPDLQRLDQAWSPRAGLVYQPSNWLSLYSSISKSFQPSGEGLSLAANAADLQPEQTRNLEVGAKTEWLGGRLMANFAAFRLDRFNMKTTDPIDPLRLVLVGAQRTDGLEFSVTGSVARRLQVMAGYALLDPVIRRSNTVTSGVLVQGKQAAFVPRHSGNLWATYRFERGFGIGAGLTSLDRRYAGNDNLVRLPGYARFDASFFYRAKRWEAAINLRNVLNRTYYETAHTNFQLMPGAPANGLVTLRYRL